MGEGRLTGEGKLNAISKFMRERVELDDKAQALGIMPSTYTHRDVRLFFIKAADEIDRLVDENGKWRDALTELHAMVKGESSWLLDEDSGGSARLALEIEALLDI